MKKSLISPIAALLLLQLTVSGQGLSIDQTNQEYTIDFDTEVQGVNALQFQGAGFSPTPNAGELDSDAWTVSGLSDGDLDFGETNLSGDYARGFSASTNPTTGGIYAFEVEEGNHALGIQPGGSDFTPGELGLKISNTTAEMIDTIFISFDLWIRNNQDRSSRILFGMQGPNQGAEIILDADADTTGEGSDTLGWVKKHKWAWFSFPGFSTNEFVILKWFADDLGGSGSRDEFAIDNITVSLERAVVTELNSTLKNEAHLYPNPVQDQLSIEGVESIESIIAVSLGGERFLLSEQENRWNTSGLSNGLYVLQINTGTEVISKRITIE